MKNLVATYFLKHKNVRGYLVVYVLAAVLIACISLIPSGTGFLFWLMKTMQLVAFTGLGLLHTSAIERGLQFLEDKFQNKISFTALLTLLIGASLLAFYYFVNRNMMVMALSGSCAFFLSFTVMQLWNMYKLIPLPGQQALTWYGFDEFADHTDIADLSSIPVTFALTTSEFDKEMIPFSVKAPLHMELSKVFNMFLVAAKKTYNIPITSTDENDRPYGWQFFTASMKGLLNIQFNPEMSIGVNTKIKPNTVILVKRVKASGAYHISPRPKMDLTIN